MSMRYSGRARRSFIIGSKRVAAGDEPRLGPELFEQRDGVVDAGRPLVVERCRCLHGAPFVGRPASVPSPAR